MALWSVSGFRVFALFFPPNSHNKPSPKLYSCSHHSGCNRIVKPQHWFCALSKAGNIFLLGDQKCFLWQAPKYSYRQCIHPSNQCTKEKTPTTNKLMNPNSQMAQTRFNFCCSSSRVDSRYHQWEMFPLTSARMNHSGPHSPGRSGLFLLPFIFF